MPELSILIPVYNGMPFLPIAIESVLAERSVDFEVIVSDDASTDGTSDYLANIRDSRVRVIRHDQNLGATPNWNFALSQARADLVILLCADDFLKPNAIEHLVELSRAAGPTVCLISGRRQVVDERGRTIIPRVGVGRLKGLRSGPDAIRTVVRSGRNLIGEPSAVLFRRSAANAVGGFLPKYRFCPDLDLWVRMLAVGDYLGTEEVVAGFRVSKSSGSVQMAKIQRDQGKRFFSEVLQTYSQVSRSDYLVGLAKLNLAAFLRRLVYSRAD